jgi:hypothetical protein
MSNRGVSVCIALIHNNNIQRNAYIRPQLEKMADNFELHIAAEKIEVSFQPEIRPHGTALAFMRDVMYRKLDREWHRYRLLKPLSLLRDTVGFLKGSFIKYIVERNGIGATWKKNSAIEVLVTEKHVRAWGRFLDSEADFLICFEDDALFKDDSLQKINDLFELLATRNSFNTPIYVDLAGGCKIDELKISNLETSQDASFQFYSKPVTNTACAYLMSRKLVVDFHKVLIRKPWMRLIGIDWMMNGLFIIMAKHRVKCVCLHANPTIFKHGTTTGEYISWQANVPHRIG